MNSTHGKKNLVILIGMFAVLLGLVVFLKTGDMGTNALWNISRQGTWMLPLVVVASLIDSINPCAFGILLLTVGFLLSLGKVRSDILKFGSVYIIGLFAVYILIGLGILQALHIFNTPHFMAKVGAVLLVALGGLNLVNQFFPSFPIKVRIPQAAHHAIAKLMGKASIPAVFLLGLLVGLCEFPCTGGPYLMVLGLLHDQGTYFAGIGYLLLYNLIFISPLILLLLIASNKGVLEKVKQWKKEENSNMRLWGGIAMIILGLLILFI